MSRNTKKEENHMAGSLNKVFLLGNLGADPEIRRTEGGKVIANLNVATSETWRDKNSGEKKEKTEWHKVVIFNEGLAKVAEQYLRKGSKVYIEGANQTRKWQDKDGNDRYSTEVVLNGFSSQLILLGDKSESGGSRDGSSRSNDRGGGDYGGQSHGNDRGSSQSNDRGNSNYGGGTSGGRNFSRDIDDEIPFAMEWR